MKLWKPSRSGATPTMTGAKAVAPMLDRPRKVPQSARLAPIEYAPSSTPKGPHSRSSPVARPGEAICSE